MSTKIHKNKWKIVKLDGESVVRVSCPKCNGSWLLDHQISMNGVVSPSLECPEDSCDFHDEVVLIGFGDNASAPTEPAG